MKILSREEAAKYDKTGDILAVYDDENNSRNAVILVMSTFQDFANQNVGTACGDPKNNAWRQVCNKHPEFKKYIVVTCLVQENHWLWTSSCMIKVDGEAIAAAIQDAFDDAGGSLRSDYTEPGWNYFETE